MARAASSKSKALATATPAGSTGKSMVNIDAELNNEVANIKDAIGQASGNKIKVEPAGNFILPDGSNLGPEMQIVIVDFVSSNKFYSQIYNAQNPTPPDCYAIGKVISDMKPEADSPAIQSDSCASCPLNVFGSGANGKSKACKNTRILSVLVLDPENPEAHNAPDAPLYTFELPPTAIRSFDGAVSMVARSLNGPPIKSIITVTAKPAGTYALISFIDPIPNPDYATHFHRRPETVDTLFRKPDFAAFDAKQAAPQRGRAAPARGRQPARR